MSLPGLRWAESRLVTFASMAARLGMATLAIGAHVTAGAAAPDSAGAEDCGNAARVRKDKAEEATRGARERGVSSMRGDAPGFDFQTAVLQVKDGTESVTVNRIVTGVILFVSERVPVRSRERVGLYCW